MAPTLDETEEVLRKDIKMAATTFNDIVKRIKEFKQLIREKQRFLGIINQEVTYGKKSYEQFAQECEDAVKRPILDKLHLLLTDFNILGQELQRAIYVIKTLAGALSELEKSFGQVGTIYVMTEESIKEVLKILYGLNVNIEELVQGLLRENAKDRLELIQNVPNQLYALLDSILNIAQKDMKHILQLYKFQFRFYRELKNAKRA